MKRNKAIRAITMVAAFALLGLGFYGYHGAIFAGLTLYIISEEHNSNKE